MSEGGPIPEVTRTILDVEGEFISIIPEDRALAYSQFLVSGPAVQIEQVDVNMVDTNGQGYRIKGVGFYKQLFDAAAHYSTIDRVTARLANQPPEAISRPRPKRVRIRVEVIDIE